MLRAADGGHGRGDGRARRLGAPATPPRPSALRDCEHRADERKRELRAALTVAFSTPLEPEDIFELSRGLDGVLNSAKNTVREAEVMQTGARRRDRRDGRRARRGHRGSSPRRSRRSGRRAARATAAADAAVKSQRRLEHVYRAAMSALIAVDDLREVAARRELYRRLARTSDDLRDVAERVWYSVLKES